MKRLRTAVFILSPDSEGCFFLLLAVSCCWPHVVSRQQRRAALEHSATEIVESTGVAVNHRERPRPALAESS